MAAIFERAPGPTAERGGRLRTLAWPHAGMDIFEALADPTRRDIIAMLAAGERSEGDIAGGFPITGPSVSRHLKVLEFVRNYPHPVERVWRAVTDPAEVAIWLIRPTVWEPQTGGAYRFHDDGFAGVVQAVEPQRLIRFGPRAGTPADAWPGTDSYFQFEFKPLEGGTRLRFVQHAAPSVADPDEPDPAFVSPGRPGALAGWHAAFDELGFVPDGTPLRERLPQTRPVEIARNWASMGWSAAFTPGQKKRIIIGLRARERWFDYVDRYREHVRTTRPNTGAASGHVTRARSGALHTTVTGRIGWTWGISRRACR